MFSPRAAAHVLNEIARLLELRGEAAEKVAPYDAAARALHLLPPDDRGAPWAPEREGVWTTLAPDARSVVRELMSSGSSELLEQLRENTPEGLVEMLRVPGLGTARIRRIHEQLGIESLHELEEAARDGRLAALPGFGSRTADKVRRGITHLRDGGARLLYPHAARDAARLLDVVRAHPDVLRAEVAGSLRRHAETIGDIDIVAATRVAPALVAAGIAHSPGVREVVGGGGPSIAVRYDDGTRLDLFCVTPDRFALAWWWATGTHRHCQAVVTRAAARGLTIGSEHLREGHGRIVPVEDEAALYDAAGLTYIAPELREDLGEVEAAATRRLPRLVEEGDVAGVLHCHSHYSDGGATIAELARAAEVRGWRYLGISDHSQSASYAGGLTRDDILRQHDEIDAVNAAQPGVRLLKGIEADILPCGRVDYDAAILDRFDYVIASVHSRLGMNETQMTERVLKAMNDPHVTIIGHPTGRLLLARESFAIDVDALLEKAGESGVAIELNADPHRLDLDWRHLRRAHARGAVIEIGPDAHSVAGLDHLALGVGIARKGWLAREDVLNTRSADDVLAFARSRRADAAPRVAVAGSHGA